MTWEFIGLYQSQLEILAYVGLAMLLGAAIGFERELEDKPAGLRTHMLVSGAAALFVALGTVVIEQFIQELSYSCIQSDPIRIMQVVVTGVSFLGAEGVHKAACDQLRQSPVGQV
jgi:putative Mg2+ transporter-C (MgtC) family protein